jgi:hypothetical protein
MAEETIAEMDKRIQAELNKQYSLEEIKQLENELDDLDKLYYEKVYRRVTDISTIFLRQKLVTPEYKTELADLGFPLGKVWFGLSGLKRMSATIPTATVYIEER